MHFELHVKQTQGVIMLFEARFEAAFKCHRGGASGTTLNLSDYIKMMFVSNERNSTNKIKTKKRTPNTLTF